MDELKELFHRCIVPIQYDHHLPHGTGFFVSPNLVLTCYHCVSDSKQPIFIRWKNSPIVAGLENYSEELDLAFLEVDIKQHPCVLFDPEIDVDNLVYSFGVTKTNPTGESFSLRFEGYSNSFKYYKFKEGNVVPGNSGAPLLNLHTGYVCGITRTTRDLRFDLGAGAIPCSTAFEFRQDLLTRQLEYHNANTDWETTLDRHFKSPLRRKSFVFASSAKSSSGEVYIERPAESIAEQHLRIYDQPLLIFGGGKVGKTKLLMKLLMSSKKLGKRTIYLDFNLLDNERRMSAAAFYRFFCKEIAGQLGIKFLDEFDLDNIYDCKTFMETFVIKAPPHSLVMAIDHLDKIVDSDFYSDFMVMLRMWTENDKHPDQFIWTQFQLVLAAPVQLRLLFTMINGSNLDSYPIPIGDFSRDEISTLAAQFGIVFSEIDLENIDKYLGGYPVLVSQLIKEYKYSNNNDINAILSKAIRHDGIFGEHLYSLLDRVQNNSIARNALLRVINDMPLSSVQQQYLLLRWGLIKQMENGRFALRCGIYKDFFKEHLV